MWKSEAPPRPRWLRSLKGRLALWILLPTALLTALDLAVVYADSERIATSVQQQLLRGAARAISEQLVYADGDYEISVPPAAFEMLKNRYRDRVFYAVHSQDGRLIAGDDGLPAQTVGAAQAPGIDEEAFRVAKIGEESVRIITLSHALTTSSSGQYAVTQVAQTLRGRDEFRDELVRSTLRGHLLLFSLIALSLTLSLRWTLKPLFAFGQTLQERPPGSLQRIDARQAPRELAPVIDALNDYAERLDHTLSSYEKFVSNSAHHLRTAFAIIGSQVDYGLRQAAEDGEGRERAARREVFSAIRRTLAQCAKLVNQFLALASAEQARQPREQSAPTALAELIGKVVDDFAPLAHRRHIEIGVDEFDESLRIDAPADLLREVFANLIDNAIAHMGRPGAIALSLCKNGERAVFSIIDDGVGIAEEWRPKVFERFFRIDRSAAHGSGLGLSIVKETCEALGARVALSTPENGRGLQVTIEFPLPS